MGQKCTFSSSVLPVLPGFPLTGLAPLLSFQVLQLSKERQAFLGDLPVESSDPINNDPNRSLHIEECSICSLMHTNKDELLLYWTLQDLLSSAGICSRCHIILFADKPKRGSYGRFREVMPASAMGIMCA